MPISPFPLDPEAPTQPGREPLRDPPESEPPAKDPQPVELPRHDPPPAAPEPGEPIPTIEDPPAPGTPEGPVNDPVVRDALS